MHGALENQQSQQRQPGPCDVNEGPEENAPIGKSKNVGQRLLKEMPAPGRGKLGVELVLRHRGPPWRCTHLRKVLRPMLHVCADEVERCREDDDREDEPVEHDALGTRLVGWSEFGPEAPRSRTVEVGLEEGRDVLAGVMFEEVGVADFVGVEDFVPVERQAAFRALGVDQAAKVVLAQRAQDFVLDLIPLRHGLDGQRLHGTGILTAGGNSGLTCRWDGSSYYNFTMWLSRRVRDGRERRADSARKQPTS